MFGYRCLQFRRKFFLPLRMRSVGRKKFHPNPLRNQVGPVSVAKERFLQSQGAGRVHRTLWGWFPVALLSFSLSLSLSLFPSLSLFLCVCMRVCVYLRVCVCVCVYGCERKSERKYQRVCVSVCVCVCVSSQLHVSGCHGNAQKSHSSLLPRKKKKHTSSISLAAIHFKCRLPSRTAIPHPVDLVNFHLNIGKGRSEKDEINCLNSWKMRFYFFGLIWFFFSSLFIPLSFCLFDRWEGSISFFPPTNNLFVFFFRGVEIFDT